MTQNSLKFTSSAVTDRGLSEKRPQNEDSYLEMPECGLFSVADGVGGAQAGDVASQMAMEILGEAFANLPEGGDVEELMHVAITRANGAIYQMSNDLPQLSTMATTIVALHIAGNIATIGHAGDSRIYRLDSRGSLFRETQDHSVVEEEFRAGRMTREQAEHHPSKNVISRALGAESTVEIDMKTIMFEPNTAFLLCSDGITRHIPDTELRDLLASPDAPVTICQQMKEICYSRGAEDNLTAVLIKIDGAAEAQTIDDDLEENTIATARTTTESEAFFSDPQAEEYDDIPTYSLPTLDDEDYKTQQVINAEHIDIPEEVTKNNAVSLVEEKPLETVTPVEKVAPVETNKSSYDYDEPKSGGGFLGKLLPALLALIIGSAIGAAGMYYWLLNQPKKDSPPPISQPQTTNIDNSAFEKNLKNIDTDPNQYIISSGGKATDAEGFYLLGRAYSLTGRYDEAKKELSNARTSLKEMKEENRATLANEIAIALSAIESPESKKVLETEKNKTEPAKVSNTNSASNANASK